MNNIHQSKKKKKRRENFFVCVTTLNCSRNYLVFVCLFAQTHTKFHFSHFLYAYSFFLLVNLLPENSVIFFSVFCSQFPKTISCVSVCALLSNNGKKFFHILYEYFKNKNIKWDRDRKSVWEKDAKLNVVRFVRKLFHQKTFSFGQKLKNKTKKTW